MKAAALSQFNEGGFILFELKQNYSGLDIELRNNMDKLEKSIKRVFISRKKIEKEAETLFPLLFNIRMQGLSFFGESDKTISEIQDGLLPEIEKLSEVKSLNKLSYNIADSLSHNRKLTDFFKKSGHINKEQLKTVSELNYESFGTFVILMPPPIRKTVLQMTKASLFIEFFSIAALMIKDGALKISGAKMLELNKFSEEINHEYMGLIHGLINMGEKELFTKEHDEWAAFSMQNLSGAYGDDEPDYNNMAVKEPNPEYKR